MAATDLNNFLHSLAKYMVGRAAAQNPPVAISYLDEPRGLWRNKAPEVASGEPSSPGSSVQPLTDPYSVLRIFGGKPTVKDPQQRYSIQCLTTSPSSEDAAMQRAQVLFETLLYPPDDPQQPLQPLNSLQIDGFAAADDSSTGPWWIVSVEPLQRPGKVGVDQRSRPMIVFNFDIGFYYISE